MPLLPFAFAPRTRSRALAAGWLVPALALAGWLILLVAHGGLADSPAVRNPGGHGHHAHYPPGAKGPAWLSLGWHAVAMAAVMLVPAALGPLDHVRRSTFAGAWQAQRAVFLAGFLTWWLACSVAIVASSAALNSLGLSWAVIAALAASFAGFWQISPTKKTALAQCHASRPVYGGGIPGLCSAWSYGLFSGSACVRACGPMMLTAMVLPIPVVAMAGAILLSVREQAWPPARRQHGGLLAALALLCMLFALLEVGVLTR